MSVERSSANHKEMTKEERRRLAFIAGAILAALSVFVVLLRLYGLPEDPPGITNDEGVVGVFALQVLQGRHAPFFPERSSGVEAFGVYAVALATLFFGRSLLAFNLPAALASASTVFAVFWLGWLLFGWDENSGQSLAWSVRRRCKCWSDGDLHRSDDCCARGIQSQLSSTVPCSECGAALVGVESIRPRQQSPVGDCTCRGMRRLAALYLYPFAFCTFLFSFLWPKFSDSPQFRCHRKSSGYMAKGCCLCRRNRTSSCSDSHILCSSPRKLFHSQQRVVALP